MLRIGLQSRIGLHVPYHNCKTLKKANRIWRILVPLTVRRLNPIRSKLWELKGILAETAHDWYGESEALEGRQYQFTCFFCIIGLVTILDFSVRRLQHSQTKPQQDTQIINLRPDKSYPSEVRVGRTVHMRDEERSLPHVLVVDRTISQLQGQGINFRLETSILFYFTDNIFLCHTGRAGNTFTRAVQHYYPQLYIILSQQKIASKLD